MAKSKETDAPEDPQVPDVNPAEDDPAIVDALKEVARGDARSRAIQEYMTHGYKSGHENRKVRSPAHAEFLCRAGTITLP